MYNKVIETIKKFNMLNNGENVVVGLSGGADSCALTHILARLSEKMDLHITAVHINHGIRGEEAERDERSAEEFCRRLNIEFIAYHCDIPSEAAKRGIGEEEAGRLVRYEKFYETAEKKNGAKTAVAHNMNDKAETLIMNLCRGAGMKGLAGIKPVSGSIIRPLIFCTRDEIEKYCDDNNIEYCTDSTNLQNEYTRNKIRNILLPWLSENINPAAAMNMANASELLREEEEYLESKAQEQYKKLLKDSGDGFVSLNADGLASEHGVIRRRVLRIALRSLRPDMRDFGRKHTESAEDILMGDTGRRISLPGGITVSKGYGLINILYDREKQGAFCYDIEPGKKYFIKETESYVLLSLNEEKNIKNAVNICTKKIDYDKIKDKIQLRTRQTGDFISIKNGRKKIKDIFIDDKIPSDKRDSYPLLVCGKSVIIVGDRLGTDYYVGQDTKNILYIYIWEE
ncbi:MAG: tRNA lysidine(34) synthetase TilS [Clostridiales bacterium]|nr:tRNA lysidine(34) synthetase TilS [Clostridiales bacterium]